MNVLFDATWIAKNINHKVMHGGLRVAYELAKHLLKRNDINTFLTHTSLQKIDTQHLHQFLEKECLTKTTSPNNKKNDIIRANTPNIVNYTADIQQKVMGFHRIHAILLKYTNFIEKQQLSDINVYHAPVEAIPKRIHQHQHIKPFFTALDLIPFVKPEFAPKDLNQLLKPAYDSINENTIVLTISQSTKNDLLNYRKDLTENQVIVTHIAADKDIFYQNTDQTQKQTVMKKYDINFENYFFALNRIQKYKNTEHVIKCFCKFISQNNLHSDVGLVLVGTHHENPNFADLIKQYSKSVKIKWINYVEDADLSVIYSNAMCFSYMSLYEGFGLPILEAMQCGVPIVCSNTSAMPEVIGDAGLCIDPTDEDLLCQSMLNIYQNQTLRETLIQKGLKRSKQFSWEKYTDDVIQSYKKYAK